MRTFFAEFVVDLPLLVHYDHCPKQFGPGCMDFRVVESKYWEYFLVGAIGVGRVLRLLLSEG